jgi:hypothetical protein
MRLPATLMAAVKSRAKARGVPYTRFIREVLEAALGRGPAMAEWNNAPPDKQLSGPLIGYAKHIGRSWDRDDRDGPNVAAVCYLLQPF